MNEPFNLANFAEYKKLPVKFLKEHGVRDHVYKHYTGGSSAVIKFTIYDVDGNSFINSDGIPRFMYRKGWDSGSYRWSTFSEEDGPTSLIGRQHLQKYKDDGKGLILVEGQTCWLTGVFHELPVLALPGNTMQKLLFAEDLDDIPEITLLQELGNSGEIFIEATLKRLDGLNYQGKIYILKMPDGLDDLSDLHVRSPENFKVDFEAAWKESEEVTVCTSLELFEGADDDAEVIEPEIVYDPGAIAEEVEAELDGMLEKSKSDKNYNWKSALDRGIDIIAKVEPLYETPLVEKLKIITGAGKTEIKSYIKDKRKKTIHEEEKAKERESGGQCTAIDAKGPSPADCAESYLDLKYESSESPTLGYYKGQFHPHMNGVYGPIDEDVLKADLNSELAQSRLRKKAGEAKFINSVINMLKSRDLCRLPDIPVPFMVDTGKPPTYESLILNDGILDVDAWCRGDECMRDHTPNHFDTFKLNASHTDNPECPNTDKYLPEIFGADKADKAGVEGQELLDLYWEQMASILFPSLSVEKCFIYHGPSGTGKSTLSELCQALAGEKYTSHASLSEMSKPHGTTCLYNTRLNFDADSDYVSATNSALFKKLITGDRFRINPKGQPSFSYLYLGKLAFAANDLPGIGESGDAIYERMSIIPLTVKFRNTANVIKKVYKLMTPEVTGWLWKYILPAYKRLKENGGRLSEPQICKDILKTYQEEQDFTLQFLISYMRTTTNRTDVVTHGAAFKAYVFQSGERGLKPKGQPNFIRDINKHIAKKHQGGRESKGRRSYGWQYMQLVDTEPPVDMGPAPKRGLIDIPDEGGLPL